MLGIEGCMARAMQLDDMMSETQRDRPAIGRFPPGSSASVGQPDVRGLRPVAAAWHGARQAPDPAQMPFASVWIWLACFGDGSARVLGAECFLAWRTARARPEDRTPAPALFHAGSRGSQ